MLDLEKKRITVSRDVVFDETKGWNWKRIDGELRSYDDFNVVLGGFGNHGLAKPSDQAHGQALEQGSSSKEEEIQHDEAETMDTNTVHIEEEDESDHETRELPRRSERQTSRPRYLEDYVLVADEEGEMILLCLSEEPRNFEEARQLKEWIEACKDELQSIEKNKV